MKTKNKIIKLQTKKELDIIDLTDQVKEFVAESQIKNGLVNVQTMHTTTMIVLNEHEPLLWEDVKKHISDLSPKEKKYQHDDFKIRTVNMCDGECANGHSHCKAFHFPPNITLNLINGKMQTGTWQRILFFELDRKRERKVQVQIIGE